MGETHWPMRNGDFSYILRVDENSSVEEIEAEVEYWMHQIVINDVQGEHRSCILQAIGWMNGLAVG